MPDNAPKDWERAKTWLEWQEQFAPDAPIPDDNELVTREDIFASLSAVGIEMSLSTLKRWETAGMVPRPIRRWHNGATRGLYARWAAYAVAVAHDLHSRRQDPKVIALLLRRMTRQLIDREAFHHWLQERETFAPFITEIADTWAAEHDGQRPDGGELILRDRTGVELVTFRFDFPSE